MLNFNPSTTDSTIDELGQSYGQLWIDLTPLDEPIAKNDFEVIVKDPDLFFAQFCKIFAQKKNATSNPCKINIQIIENQAYIESKTYVFNPYILATKNEVERFRLIALEALKTHLELNFAIIHTNPKYPNNNAFLKPFSTESINLKDADHQKDKLNTNGFFDFVHPVLADFFDSLGIDYSESKTTQLAIRPFADGDQPENVKATAIKVCLRNQYRAYPFLPPEVPVVGHPERPIYDRYKLGSFCDYTILSLDGEKIPVHGLILDMYGGPFFQMLLSKDMRETNSKLIHMHYPFEVIKHVIESFYLGPEHLDKKYFEECPFDVYGVLACAHAYDLQPLFKQMIKLLMLIADSSHARPLKEIADLYKDEHLCRLAEYYSNPINPQLKV